eukprot:scaffold71437_cov32-Attheya_sp.AAC.1
MDEEEDNGRTETYASLRDCDNSDSDSDSDSVHHSTCAVHHYWRNCRRLDRSTRRSRSMQPGWDGTAVQLEWISWWWVLVLVLVLVVVFLSPMVLPFSAATGTAFTGVGVSRS